MVSPLVPLRRRVLFALLISTLAAGTASAGVVAKFRSNGAFLRAEGYDATGCIWMSVYASKGGSKTSPATWMEYYVYDVCAEQWIAYGNGLIANSALTVRNKVATLQVTPVASADFYAEGQTGTVQLTATADGNYSASFSGHSVWEYAGRRTRSHGSWTERSAAAAGTVFGFQINFSAVLGDSQDKWIEIDRGSN